MQNFHLSPIHEDKNTFIEIYKEPAIPCRVKVYTEDEFRQIFNRSINQKKTVFIKAGTDTLYIKISDLKKILKKDLKPGMDVTQLVYDHNFEKTMEWIKVIAHSSGIITESTVEENIQNLHSIVHYSSLETLIKTNQFKSYDLVRVLVNIGKLAREAFPVLNAYIKQPTEDTYGFKLNPNEIYISIKQKDGSIKDILLQEKPKQSPAVLSRSRVTEPIKSDKEDSEEDLGTFKENPNISSEEDLGTFKENPNISSEEDPDTSRIYNNNSEEIKNKKNANSSPLELEEENSHITSDSSDAPSFSRFDFNIKPTAPIGDRLSKKIEDRHLTIKVFFNEKENKELTSSAPMRSPSALDRKLLKQAGDLSHIAWKGISEKALLNFLAQLEYKEDKLLAISTFREINHRLATMKPEDLKSYYGKTWGKTFKYKILDDTILLTTDPIDAGNFKKVSQTFALFQDQVNQLVELKIKHNVSSEDYKANVQDAFNEARLLDTLSKTDHQYASFIMSPYLSYFLVENKKVIADLRTQPLQKVDLNKVFTAFQKRYEPMDKIFFSVPVETQVRFLKEACLGLMYLHQQGFAHCDFKISNLLVNDSKAMLADFGTVIPLQQRPHSLTVAYGSPQLIHFLFNGTVVNEAFGQAAVIKPDARASAQDDIFSVGVVLLEYIVGQITTNNKSPLKVFRLNKPEVIYPGALNSTELKDVIDQIRNHLENQTFSSKQIEERHLQATKLQLLPLLEKLLSSDPAKRPSLEETVAVLNEIENGLLKDKVKVIESKTYRGYQFERNSSQIDSTDYKGYSFQKE